MAKFRFQDLKIWQLAIQIADELFDIADKLEQKRLYRFVDQLRGAGMSMSNNIAEGSGSSSKKDFKHFLNIARRSTFENANILILLNRRNLISEETLDRLLDISWMCSAAKPQISKKLSNNNALRSAPCSLLPAPCPLLYALCSMLPAPCPMPFALCAMPHAPLKSLSWPTAQVVCL
ncbi:MAG: four helix bundle protein [Pseudomonadota bacterium]|nr:four helix bundle protein [Pseudomonadota bacterium]